jgi:hypothetical protein
MNQSQMVTIQAPYGFRTYDFLSRRAASDRLAVSGLHLSFPQIRRFQRIRKWRIRKLTRVSLGARAVYTQLISFEGDEYYSAVAKTVDEARKLSKKALNTFARKTT